MRSYVLLCLQIGSMGKENNPSHRGTTSIKVEKFDKTVCLGWGWDEEWFYLNCGKSTFWTRPWLI